MTARNRSDVDYYIPLFSGVDGAARARFRTQFPGGTYNPYVVPPPVTLTGDTNFYVNSSVGDNTHTGLGPGANSWKTAQHALDVLNTYDLNGFHAFVNLTGTFAEDLHVLQTRNGQIVFIGPATIQGSIRSAAASASFYIQTLTIKATRNSTLLTASKGYIGFASLTLDNTDDYNVTGIYATRGATVEGSSQFTANGPHYAKLFSADHASSLTGAFSGFALPDLPAWQTAGWAADGSGTTMSMSGINKVIAPATGKRYTVSGGATLHVGSGSPADTTYLPGDVAGTSSGSSYT